MKKISEFCSTRFGLELLDQRVLLVDGRCDSRDFAIDLRAHAAPGNLTRRAQLGSGMAQVLDRPDKWVVVAKQPGARLEDIALQSRVVEGRSTQGIENAFMAGRVWRGALDQQVGQEQKQGCRGQPERAQRGHFGALSEMARGRPSYSPVSVLRIAHQPDVIARKVAAKLAPPHDFDGFGER